MDALRERLSHIFKQRKDVTLKDASLRLGKAHQYLHQFVNGGSPKQLDLIMIIGLAEYLNIAVLELYPEATEQERKLLGLRVNKLEHSTVNIEPTEKAEHNPILLEICKRKLANAYACKLNALPLKEQNKPTPEEFNANLVELYKTAQYLKLIFEGEYLENELDKSANNLTR